MKTITPNELRQIIIEHSLETKENILDSIIVIADRYEIDLEVMATYITGSIKEMIKLQCENDGLIKKEDDPSHAFA